MSKQYPFHSFFIGLFPILFIITENPGQVNWTDIVVPLLMIELTVGLLLFVAYRISKSWTVAGNYVSMLVAWFYSYGCFYQLFIGFTVNNVVLGRERWLIPLWGGLLIAGFIGLMKFRRHQDLNKALNVILPVLLGLLFLKAGLSHYATFGTESKVYGEKAVSDVYRLTTQRPDNSKSKHLPSIYYIILDSYSANSSLKDIYGYDNESFTSSLKEKGFYVAKKSCSNYAITGLSLPSSLNMNYLNEIFDLSHHKGSKAPDIAWSIGHNEITDYLSRRGYKIVKLGSWWSPTASEKSTTGLSGCVTTEFSIVLLRMTILRPIVDQIISPLLRKGIIDQFNRTADFVRSDEPHFVFSHIICPHPPFVFGANGENIGLLKSLTMRLSPETLYVDQVKYINKKLESLVNKILQESKSPPIIILQADHGSGFIFHPMNNRNIPGHSEEDLKFLKAQFKILNAYYLPKGGEKYLYDSLSPVNTFRLILNIYFGENHELLPDRRYYSNYVQPFNFLDVTERIKD